MAKPGRLVYFGGETHSIHNLAMYRADTDGIEVTVAPDYLIEESRPDDRHFFWAYTVTISNRSPRPVQLISRYWRIVDAEGRVEEVFGDGVVGVQPHIAPGQSYRYTSGCPLSTPHGIMSGHYAMRTAAGDWLRVEIPAFSLDLPGAGHTLN